MSFKKMFVSAAAAATVLTSFGLQNAPEHKILFEKAKYAMETKGDLNGAIKIFSEIIQKYPKEREFAAKSQLYIGLCYERLGLEEAQKAFQAVIDKYPEQTEAVKAANEYLSLLLRAVAGKENKEFNIRKVSDSITDGAISPDGRYISYLDNETGDLAVHEIATGKKRRVTTNVNPWDEYVESSNWSPDGKQMAYAWQNKNGRIELRIIGLDGSKPRILYNKDDYDWASTYDWSPDGKQILAIFYKSNKTYIQIALVSAADGSVRVLKTLEQGPPIHMCFSPDGRYVVYDFPQKDDFQLHDIAVLSTEGSREIPLVENSAHDYVLGWAPDGKNILFSSDRRKSTDAWDIQFSDGIVQGTPQLIKSNIGQVFPMGFTRNGSFCYGIMDVLRDIYFAELDPETGKMLVPPNKMTTRFEGSLSQPEYSPDGKSIAYISERFGAFIAISIQSLETGKTQEYPSRLIRNMDALRWSPDGRSILFGAWDWKGNKGIWRMDTQSGTFTLTVPPADKTESFYFLTSNEWSRDGKAIFLGRLISNQTQIKLRELENGTEKELYRESGPIASLSCSPDGKWLAFVSRRPGQSLKIMPAAGGEPRELYTFKNEGLIRGIRWTSDGKYILFNRGQSLQDTKRSLWRIPMEGGEPHKFELEWNTLFFASFHPDGRHVAFSTQDFKSEISGNFIMENFLPAPKAAK